MPGTFSLQIVTPEREVFNREVEFVRLPGMAGSFGVLRNHAPLIAALEPGEVEVESAESGNHLFAIGGGFFQVANNKAILLADSADEPGAIDLEQAQRAEQEARERLSGEFGPGFEAERQQAEQALKRARTRSKVAANRR